MRQKGALPDSPEKPAFATPLARLGTSAALNLAIRLPQPWITRRETHTL
jgi:hypothetical protein